MFEHKGKSKSKLYICVCVCVCVCVCMCIYFRLLNTGIPVTPVVLVESLQGHSSFYVNMPKT